MATINEINARLVRIETRLTRLMIYLGVDYDQQQSPGAPSPEQGVSSRHDKNAKDSALCAAPSLRDRE